MHCASMMITALPAHQDSSSSLLPEHQYHMRPGGAERVSG
jgi:hypothetical protein